jgi:hypothetical protein
MGWDRGASSPATWTANGKAGRFQIRADGLSAHTGLLLDAPQRPPEPPKDYYLLLFLFVQDIAHGARA